MLCTGYKDFLKPNKPLDEKDKDNKENINKDGESEKSKSS